MYDARRIRGKLLQRMIDCGNRRTIHYRRRIRQDENRSTETYCERHVTSLFYRRERSQGDLLPNRSYRMFIAPISVTGNITGMSTVSAEKLNPSPDENFQSAPPFYTTTKCKLQTSETTFKI